MTAAMNSFDDIDDEEIERMEKNSAGGLALPDNVSSFYERQYNLDADDADANADVEQDEFNYAGQHRRPLHLHVESNITRNDTTQFFDDEIETIALEYDMGISNETKLCSRWCRRFFSCLPCCRRSHEIAGDGLDDKPSNEELLSIAFISFLSFTVAQAVASYFARSEAMLGDSIAMGVDAFTYGFNLIAERMKNRADVLIQSQMELEMHTLQEKKQQTSGMMEDEYDHEYDHEHEDAFELNNTSKQDDLDIERKTERAKRKLKLTLELIPPFISVITLVACTAFILHESVAMLVLDSQRDANLQDSPNVSIMFVFSSLNLIVDAVNIVFFSKADHAFGYDTFEENVHQVETFDNGIDRSGAIDNGNEMQSNGEVGKYVTGVNAGTGAEGDVIGNGSDNVNSSPRSKRRGAKEQIAENFKHIIGERKRRKGGAYATVGEMDDDDEFDDAREEEYEGSEHDLNISFEGMNGHDHSMFSIDDGDDNQNDNEEGFAVEKKGEEFRENDTHSLDDNDTRSPDDNDASPPLTLNSSIDEDVIQHQVEQYYLQKGQVNLNMCSAYTHVFADTVRSLAVLIASLVGKYVDAITPEVADAIAAVIVSGIILTALIPLLSGMVRTACELISIRREEALEKILKKHRMATGTMA